MKKIALLPESMALKILGLLAMLVLTLPFASAQMDQGAIAGTVIDSTGATIPNAKVKLVNEQNGFTLERTADGGGAYVFTPLKIGVYTLTASADNFRSFEQRGVNVTAGSRADVTLTLGVVSADQSIEVSAEAPLLQTAEASTGATVSAEAIVKTPLLNRNPIFVAQLTPGVVPAEQGSRGANKGDFSANGQRSQQNNYILDGVDNNAVLVDIPNGASYVFKPVPDALAEFKVQTSNYNAELGRAAGAVVNMSIKSGSNGLHGSLWEYWRNDMLNARDFFQSTKPKYRQNQFGGTLGGPIIKDKLFFFGDAEANRIIFGQTSINSVPTLKMRGGDFSELLSPSLTNNNVRTLYTPGSGGATLQQCNGQQNVLCASQISPTAQKVANALPAPNLGVDGQTYNNYRFQSSASDNTVQYEGRIDWNASAKDQAFTRYSVFNQSQGFPSPFGILDGSGFGSGGTIQDKARNFTVSENHFFSPTLSNEFRFGYNWINARYTQAYSGTDVSSQLGLGGIPFSDGNGGTPHFNLTGMTSFGSPEYVPTDEYENVAQLLDNVSKVIHRHTLKMGVNFQRIRVQTLQPTTPRGTFNFTGKYTQVPGESSTTGFGAADMLADQMESASISNSSTVRNQRWYRSAYFQDDWQAMPKLTLNLGMRWEYFQPVEELNGRQANFLVDYNTNTAQFLLPNAAKQYTLPTSLLNSLATNNVPVVYTSNNSLANAQKMNFSPRFGFSYAVNDKTVVRGGFGLFFGGIEAVGFYPNLGANAPFLYTSNITSGSCSAGNCPTSGVTLENGFSDAIAQGLSNYVQTPDFRMYPKNIQTPYTEIYNLSVQRQINNNTTMTLSYVGSLGRHLTSNPKANQIPTLLTPGANVQAARPFNQFGGSSLESYSAVSNYNGGQATLEHRTSNGLYFLATYTFSKNLDDAFLPLGASGQSGSGYRNWRQLGYGYDYGASFADTRHRAVINVQYDLPFGIGRKYMNKSHVADALLGGWGVTTLFRVQSGQPQVVQPNNDPTNGSAQAQGIRVGDVNSTNLTNPGTGVTCATQVKTVNTWFNPCAFTNPPVATGPNDIAAYGGYGRSMVYGPGYNRVDLSLFKKFTLYRDTALDIRADLFNALNTPAYGQPNATIGSGFGQITSTRFGGSGTAAETPDARVAQLSARFHF
ncbi:MAG: carboxypeptidase regulatory-like domain-containing protein [Edaphobacter sp.]|uniref:TonB-dependent receptor n=1 Tax=Edaphobacter sp. TaxID=1934404 RepID=UPI0023843077|nr:carboxypeptidase regulatory-like domain-containing protein [Edaphobacter sp.]MDE1178664.1 carboxypeptidase regulatory-like domain-containing protein [Edaphobacter sp.]